MMPTVTQNMHDALVTHNICSGKPYLYTVRVDEGCVSGRSQEMALLHCISQTTMFLYLNDIVNILPNTVAARRLEREREREWLRRDSGSKSGRHQGPIKITAYHRVTTVILNVARVLPWYYCTQL